MDTSDQALMVIVDKIDSGVTGPEFKLMIEECSQNFEVFEKALDMTGGFEGMSLDPFMAEGHVFSRYFSEIIIDTHRLYQYGIEVFESEPNFKSWLYDTITAMGKRRPIDMIDSFAGREWVVRILARIEHSVYS